MYFLSFRDMVARAGGAVVPGVVYSLPATPADYVWNPVDIGALRVADLNTFQQAVRGRHVCFIVPGFNTPRDRGISGAGAMAQEFEGLGPLANLPSPETLKLLVPGVDLFIPVLWVGDWMTLDAIAFANYPLVLGNARKTGGYFATFLTSPWATMTRVSFFTHSFGARVLLETLQDVAHPPAGVRIAQAPPAFDTAIVTAAAAPETVLDSPFYPDAVAKLRRIVVVSSKTDNTLTWAFPPGTAVEQLLWANDPGPDIALGRDGPVLTANSPARTKTEWYDVGDSGVDGQDHGDYMPTPWQPDPTLPNGWSGKRERIGTFTQRVLPGAGAPWPPRPRIPTP